MAKLKKWSQVRIRKIRSSGISSEEVKAAIQKFRGRIVTLPEELSLRRGIKVKGLEPYESIFFMEEYG